VKTFVLLNVLPKTAFYSSDNNWIRQFIKILAYNLKLCFLKIRLLCNQTFPSKLRIFRHTLLLCVFSFSFGLAQKNNSANSVQNMVQSLKRDTCLDKKFSLSIYLIQDSVYSLPTNTLALSLYQLPFIIQRLNDVFKPICVSFEQCKLTIIPNYSLNEWEHSPVGTQVLSTWYTENTINLYIPEKMIPLRPDEPENSYVVAPLTGGDSTKNAVVIIMQDVGKPSLLHAFGHLFGLPHTYAEINPNQPAVPPAPPSVVSFEFADRSDYNNCYTHGDGFCDTDADPYLAPSTIPGSSNANCFSIGQKDGKGNFYYPPFDNFMSMYFDCRCKFTQEQYNFMARYIVAHKLHLH